MQDKEKLATGNPLRWTGQGPGKMAMEDKERLARVVELHWAGKGPGTIATMIRGEGRSIGSSTVYTILRTLGLIPPSKELEVEGGPNIVFTSFLLFIKTFISSCFFSK